MNNIKDILGYKDISPFKNLPYIHINSNNITTKGVSKTLVLYPIDKNGKFGKPVITKPNADYNFQNYKSVLEIPYVNTNNQNNKHMKNGGKSNCPECDKMYEEFLMHYSYNPIQGFQEGGQPSGQQGQMEQIMLQVIQALKQGAQPEEVMQALVQQGLPQDQAQQLMQAAMQQLGGGQPQAQMGGQPQQQGAPEQGGGEDQMQQIVQQVAQALQQGAKPEEILQQLVEMGIPQEQAQQIIQAVMQQMQGGEEQGEGAQQNPQEEQMEQQAPPAQRMGGSIWSR